MNRSAGTGLLGLGIVMVVVGAILEFAVTANTQGFNINTIGLILLIVGIVAFVAGALTMVLGSSRRTTVREDVHTTPGGQERIAERQDSGAL
jgi:hypothetical protein